MLSWCIQKYSIELCSDTSYRKAAKYLNMFLHRSDSASFHHRTLADGIEASGKALSEIIDAHAAEVLEKNNFNPETALPNNPEELPDSVKQPKVIPEEEIKEVVDKVAEEYNATHEDFPISAVLLEFLPELFWKLVVFISIDDVLVKHQKDERREDFEKKKKNVTNTVIHILVDGKAYIITAVDMKQAYRLLVAFLLENNLFENRQLVFLSDGAKDIKENCASFFSWRPYILILDWFHLAKRIKELCSMCFKLPKDKKNNLIKTILKHLWVGNIDGAISYIKGFNSSAIKNEDVRNDMCSYLERKRENICCHAIRRAFELKLSSNAAEKSNDLVVADRQKHNGMSWSFSGSGALAVLSSACRNNTLSLWVEKKDISFDMNEYGRQVVTKVAA